VIVVFANGLVIAMEFLHQQIKQYWNSLLDYMRSKMIPIEECTSNRSKQFLRSFSFCLLPRIQSIIDDIKKFWEGRETFKKYKYVHKRGILLYGDPGCGKSGIIQLCIRYVVEEMKGIVINIKDPYHVETFDEFIHSLRRIEPSRPIVVVMEDLDALTGEDKYVTSKLFKHFGWDKTN